MGKAKRKWAKADFEAVEKDVQSTRDEEAGAQPDVPDTALFVIDTAGQLESRSNVKRRRRQGLPDAPPVPAPKPRTYGPTASQTPKPKISKKKKSRLNKKRKLKQPAAGGGCEGKEKGEEEEASRAVVAAVTVSGPVIKEDLYTPIVSKTDDVWLQAVVEEAEVRAQVEAINGYDLLPDTAKIGRGGGGRGAHKPKAKNVKLKAPINAKIKNSHKLKVVPEGASFNPEYNAHQELLRQALRVEEEEQAKRESIMRRFVPGGNPLAHREWADAAEAEDALTEVGEDSAAPSRKKKAKFLKSQSDRNKDVRKHHSEMAAERARARRKMEKDINKIPALLADLQREGAEQERRREFTAQRHATPRDPRLGPRAFRPAFPDVVLTEDLPANGSLRDLKVSTEVVRDQFARFQATNRVEARTPFKQQRRFPLKNIKRFKNDVDWTPGALRRLEDDEGKKRARKKKAHPTTTPMEVAF